MLSLRKDDNALLFQLLIAAGMAIIIVFAILNIGVFINSSLNDNIMDTLDNPHETDESTEWYNKTFHQKVNRSLINLSADMDNVVDSIGIAAVVMAITLPLAAVVAIRKFF